MRDEIDQLRRELERARMAPRCAFVGGDGKGCRRPALEGTRCAEHAPRELRARLVHLVAARRDLDQQIAALEAQA